MAAAYGGKLMTYLGGGTTMVCLGLARDLGIVQVLLEAKEPMSTQQVADKLSLKERYVRELLALLAVGEVIRVDETSTLYDVPEDHKKTFENVSVFARLVPYIGRRATALSPCFKTDGPKGISYNDSHELFSILDQALTVVKTDIIDADILPVVPNLKSKLESGIKVVEFGCSHGILINKLAARFPKSTFQGVDFNPVLLEEAKKDAASLQNITFAVKNLEALPEEDGGRFDWAYVHDVIHDLPRPQNALNEIYRVLKPGGVFSLIDVGLEGTVKENVGDPMAMIYYSLSVHCCIPHSYNSDIENPAALGASWGKPVARQMIQKAGFKLVAEGISKFDHREVHFVCQK